MVNQQKPHWLVGCNKGNNGLQNETKANHGSSQPPYVHTLELSTCGPSKLQSMYLFWFHLSHQPNTAVTAKVDQVWLPWASMGMMPEGQALYQFHNKLCCSHILRCPSVCYPTAVHCAQHE